MPTYKDILLNIATFGAYSYEKQRKLETEIKSLRDLYAQGRATATGMSLNVRGNQYLNNNLQFFKKQDPRRLREIAENNTWIRACIKLYADFVAHAEPVVTTIDRKKPYDKGVKREIEQLIAVPNSINKPYSQVWEEMLEDNLVIGHGVAHKRNDKKGIPLAIDSLDASRFAIIKDWQGDPKEPHYVYLEEDRNAVALDPKSKKEIGWLRDNEAMVLLANPRSYDWLGLSPVEILYNAATSLMSGDERLLNQVLMPNHSGALFLGEGTTKEQVDQVRAEMANNKNPFVIIGGTRPGEFTTFNMPDNGGMIDVMTWFVRQVCAVFEISTAQLQLAVDTSRANTSAIIQNAENGLGRMLQRRKDLENAEITYKFGDKEKLNLMIDYPILSQRDLAIQTEISTKQFVSGLATLNESRTSLGLEALPHNVADEILLPYKDANGLPIPLSRLEAMYGGGAGNNEQQETQEGNNEQQETQKALDPTSRNDFDFETSHIVALFVPREIGQQINSIVKRAGLPELVDIDQLHVTLAYLGETDGSSEINLYEPEDFPKVNELVESTIREFSAITTPLTATISGIGFFTPNDPSGLYPVYASVDCAALPDFRKALCDLLAFNGISSADNHGFTPHITLTYLETLQEVKEYVPRLIEQWQSLEIEFGYISNAFGYNRSTYALGRSANEDETE